MRTPLEQLSVSDRDEYVAEAWAFLVERGYTIVAPGQEVRLLTDDDLLAIEREATQAAMQAAHERDGFASSASRESIVSGLRAVATAGRDDVSRAIRDLLSEFTSYPSEGRSFSIDDHQFLDSEFWDRLLDIIEGAPRPSRRAPLIGGREGTELVVPLRLSSSKERAMPERTVSTSDIRAAVAHSTYHALEEGMATVGEPYAAFDRWLAEHDREVLENEWDRLSPLTGLSHAANPYRRAAIDLPEVE